MDSNPHETRPLKRRRVDMAPPDGFATTRTARKPKPIVPKFSSAFNEDSASEPASNFQPSSSTNTDSLKEHKPILPNSTTTESVDKVKERRSILHSLIPSRPIQSDTRPSTSRPPKDRPSTFLPALHGLLISSQLKTDASILQLRAPPKPPIFSYHTPITTNAPLKPTVLPSPLLANRHSSKDLKPLQPPPVPLPPNPVIDGKNLRTISTNRVALALDLSTDNGVAELASIFLHNQHPDITLPKSRPDSHDERGLELSPEKRSDKGKKYKFIGGGLAARASALFEQSNTSLVLWQKETERRPNSFSFSDLRVNIIKILQEPFPSHTNSEKLISPGIALCRIRRETNNISSDSRHKSYNVDSLYRIVFSFPSCLTRSLFNDPGQFSEGRTVRICWPWQEISFTEESSTSVLPASLPMPPSEPILTPDAAVEDETLLCSRFLIL